MSVELSAAADHRADIQGLRAVAVLLVIANHAHVRGFQGGFLGVDIFFVISGFVITRLLHRAPPRQVGRNLLDFYSRRVRRIVPAASVVLVVTMLLTWRFLGPATDPALFTDVRWASLFAANVRFSMTGIDYFVPGLFPSLITHFWSLGVEEQFYAAFPLVVFGLTWVAPRRGRTALLAVITALGVVASAWWSGHLTPLAHVHAFYLPFSRFWELGLGALASLVPPRWPQRLSLLAGVVGAASAGALAAAVAVLTNGQVLPGVLAWWPCGATALLLISGEAARGLVARALAWRPMTIVGDCSYSLYLWHYVWLMLPLQLAHPPVGWWVVPAELLGAAACAVASYTLLENPLRRSARLRRDPWAVLLVLVICILAVWNVAWIASHALHIG
jgi:peptidoglycan/LPS O-acetylase OafA/YrhL